VQVKTNHKRLFPRILNKLVEEWISDGRGKDRSAVADTLGIQLPRLIRLSNGTNIAGAKTVARICSHLERADASRLLEAYLKDEIASVTNLAGSKARGKWGADALVVVDQVHR